MQETLQIEVDDTYYTPVNVMPTTPYMGKRGVFVWDLIKSGRLYRRKFGRCLECDNVPHILDITLYVSVISNLLQRDMITGDVHILRQLIFYLVKSPPCPTIAHIGSSGVNYAQMKLRGA